MSLKKAVVLLCVGGSVLAVSITDWMSVNGSNAAYYLSQKEDGKRWTWDILQSEVWVWRFAAGGEAEFSHPRRPLYDTGGRYPGGDRLTSRYLRYRDDYFDVHAGNYDKTFGKGMTLRSYADRDYNVHQRLDGGLADVNVHFGGRDWGDVSALWGRNDDWYERYDTDNEVRGGQLTFRPFDFVYLTGSGVQSEVENTVIKGMEKINLYAGGLGGTTKYADAYAEYAVREGYSFWALEDTPGSGIYGVVTGYFPRSSLTVEYKRYDKLGYPFNNPPPASVDARMLTGTTSGSAGEWGYYAQVTANPLDALRVRTGYSYADDKVGEQTEKTGEIKEVFGQVRYDFPFPLSLEPKFEYLSELHFFETTKSGELKRKPSLRVSFNPWEDHALFAEGDYATRMDYNLDALFTDYGAVLGYNYASWLGLTVNYETTDENVQELVDPGDPLNEILATYRHKSDWVWGEVRLSWYHRYLQNHVLAIGYGSQRGGLVCSSGVCKNQTPFNGFKVSLETTF